MRSQKNWLLSSLIVVGLTVVHTAAYAHTFNFEFTDGVSSTSDDFLLSSPGGNHWNRIGSDFFSNGTFDFGGQGTLNEFGAIAYPVGPGHDPWNDLRQIQPRRDIFQQGVPIIAEGDPSNTSPSLGWLELTRPATPNRDGLVKFFEIVDARPDRRYDVVIYHGTFQTVALTNLFGDTYASGSPGSVTVDGRTFRATTFSDVSPIEMHIGPPGYPPMGWGVSATFELFPPHGYLGIAGIQIREVVPEPSTLTLAVSAIASLVFRRRSDRLRATLRFRQ